MEQIGGYWSSQRCDNFAPTVEMGNHLVIDGFLPAELFEKLKSIVNSEFMPRYKVDHVGYAGDDSDSYFIHKFIEPYAVKSDFAEYALEIVQYVRPKCVIRSRAICYPGKEKIIEHAPHMDAPFPHNTLVLYLNDNDGFTRLSDGTVINSVANRALIINGGSLHNSSNCTNAKNRLVFALNYF